MFAICRLVMGVRASASPLLKRFAYLAAMLAGALVLHFKHRPQSPSQHPKSLPETNTALRLYPEILIMTAFSIWSRSTLRPYRSIRAWEGASTRRR